MNETAEEKGYKSNAEVPVVVFADFVCPWSYIVQDNIDRLAEEYGVKPQWKPHWLHPEVPPEGQPSHGTNSERRAAMREWMKELSPERADRMRSPDKLQFSFLAFEALTYAEQYDKALPFKAGVFEALWVEGKDIAKVETLQAAAEGAGLDPEDLHRALSEGEHRHRTFEYVKAAQRAGITKTPTMILGRTMIPGYHYYEVMQTALEKQGVMPMAEAASE